MNVQILYTFWCITSKSYMNTISKTELTSLYIYVKKISNWRILERQAPVSRKSRNQSEGWIFKDGNPFYVFTFLSHEPDDNQYA